jgi:hypothetical protein
MRGEVQVRARRPVVGIDRSRRPEPVSMAAVPTGIVGIQPLPGTGQSPGGTLTPPVYGGPSPLPGASQIVGTVGGPLPGGGTTTASGALVLYQPPPPPIPSPRNIRDRIAARFGYVPRSVLVIQTSYTQQLAALVAAETASVASLSTALSAAQSRVQALQQQLAQANARVSSLQSQIAAAQAQVASLTSSLAAGNASVAALRDQLAALQKSEGLLRAAIQSNLSAIGAIQSSVTGVAASPSVNAQSAQSSQDPSDPAFAGWAPLTAGFNWGFRGLSTSSGTYLSATGGGGIASLRDNLFAGMGYVPRSQVSSLVGQEGTLRSQLGDLTTQANGIAARTNGANGTAGLLGPQITAANATASALTDRLGALQATVQHLLSQGADVGYATSALQASIAGEHAVIGALSAQLDASAALLQKWRAGSGGFPVHIGWSFGDGGTDTSPNPTHDFGAGSFTPALTVSVDTPDGKTWTHTFKLPGLLVGQWPRSILIGGYDSGSGTFPVTVLDARGMAIPNTRVAARLKVLGIDRGEQVYDTGPTGSVGIGSNAARNTFEIDLRSLRNPSVTNVAK